MIFNIEIEITQNELELLNKVDWLGKEPQSPYGMTTEVNSLIENGIIYEVIEKDFADSAIFLTSIGKQILSKYKRI